MYSLIIAESALELVPSKIASHPAVANQAKRTGKKPQEMLLDISYHYAAMRRLPDAYRRGRPDLIHICLMNSIHTPLFLQDNLQIFIHTRDDTVITIGKGARLPKSYPRFVSLIGQLYQQKTIVSEGNILLGSERGTFSDLINRLRPKKVIGLSRIGDKSSFEGVAKALPERGCIVVGGFPRGHYNRGTVKAMDKLISVHDLPLEAHVVIARSIYEIEKTSPPIL